MGSNLLLTDGTVMCQNRGTAAWWRLTPDAFGSYVNGTWSRMPDMPAGHAPLYFASAVLRDGRVVVIGGEYNFLSAVWTNRAAVYDPVLNIWTPFSAPAGWTNIGDAQYSVMPDGKLMLANPFDTRMALLDPDTMTWTAKAGTGKIDRFDEEGWTLLPDGTLLTVDAIGAPHTEKYIPSLDAWVSAGNTPQSLTHAASQEMGPNVLLPNGTVFATGATGHNAVYTPGATSTDPGTWVSAPDFPLLNGVFLDVADGPACLLPSGNVLVGASPGIFQAPTRFFEYDGINLVSVPATPNSPINPSYVGNMLMLPNGQVMYTDFSASVQFYDPVGAPQETWRPVVTNVPGVITPGSTIVVSGTQFNGLSQCSVYGDDAGNATNYPLVRITNIQSGHVTYCKTLNHSTMAVQTGNLPVSTNVEIPSTIETGQSRLEVVCNGIASNPVIVTTFSNTIKLPTLDSVTPNTIQANWPTFDITLRGKKFTASTKATWANGAVKTLLATTFVNQSTLTATVPTTLLTATGTRLISVSLGKGQSNTLPFTVTSDTPAITSISPNTAQAGGPDFVLTINGQRFNPNNTVTWTLNSVPTVLATTYVSETQLTAVVPAAAYVGFGTATLVVKTAAGVPSNGANFVVTSDLPQINTINPFTVQAGGPDFVLTVNGVRFKNTDKVRWRINNVTTTLATTFVSDTQLTAVVPAAQTFDFGTATVDVLTANNRLSNGVAFSVTTDVPSISAVTPSTINAFSPDTPMTVSGLRFKPTDTVKWAIGSTTIVLAATYVSSTQWNATVPASGLSSGGTGTVTVYDFRNRPSNSFAVSVVNPLPVLDTISPTFAAVNSSSFVMTVTGSQFVQGSWVEFRDGSVHVPLVTTYVSSTTLTAVMPNTLLTVVGTYNIVVENPAPGGGTSLNAGKFDVLADPVLTSLNPTSKKAGTSFNLRLRGTGFVPGGQVNFDGTILPVNFVSTTEVNADIPGSALPEPGVVDVSLIFPGNLETDPLPFTITALEPMALFEAPTTALGRLQAQTVVCQLAKGILMTRAN